MGLQGIPGALGNQNLGPARLAGPNFIPPGLLSRAEPSAKPSGANLSPAEPVLYTLTPNRPTLLAVEILVIKKMDPLIHGSMDLLLELLQELLLELLLMLLLLLLQYVFHHVYVGRREAPSHNYVIRTYSSSRSHSTSSSSSSRSLDPWIHIFYYEPYSVL